MAGGVGTSYSPSDVLLNAAAAKNQVEAAVRNKVIRVQESISIGLQRGTPPEMITTTVYQGDQLVGRMNFATNAKIPGSAAERAFAALSTGSSAAKSMAQNWLNKASSVAGKVGGKVAVVANVVNFASMSYPPSLRAEAARYAKDPAALARLQYEDPIRAWFIANYLAKHGQLRQPRLEA